MATGAVPVYVYAPEALTNWPSPLVIFTYLAPAVPGGVMAVIRVAFVTLTPVAAAPPMVTPSESPVTKSVPVMITAVPPDAGPEAGVMLVNAGAGGLIVIYPARDVLLLPPALVAFSETVYVPFMRYVCTGC